METFSKFLPKLIASSSNSSSSSTSHKWKYEVFLSFRGEDTRNNFTSHLYEALCRKSINTYIDYKLKRGKEITSALLKVIEESMIAVIIFSKDYASSTFCLDEVAKIVECNQIHGQIIVPIFYHVDPSEVEKQGGNFEIAFVKHEIHNFSRVHEWKAALEKVANMAGWHIDGSRPESELVEIIANDIFEKLKKACGSSSDRVPGLVGMQPRIGDINALLFNESSHVAMIGIWGMGGIGKTTLAEAVFSQIKDQFKASCFLSSVRINSERDCDYITKQLFSQISGDKDANITTSDIRSTSFLARMLNKKILVVVDDVNNPQQLEFFVRYRHIFGEGSRIIVTSRDKHTLVSSRVDNVYEVQRLDFKDAEELFFQKAFDKASTLEEFRSLSSLFIKYTDGNPLAIQILGSFLFGKNALEWKDAWDRLQKYPNEGIQNVLKISYNSLDKEEKDIFLHLACFFRGERIEEVKRILNACGFNAIIGLRVLIDKSLVTIKKVRIHDCLEMHDLLQQIGRNIVQAESSKPGKRSRLWDHEDISRVLKRNTGTDAIEAIGLDMSKIDKIDLNPDVFKSMSSLKLLKFYNSGEEQDGKLHFPHGLECLPNELRYFYWHGYPLESLPPTFDGEDLVELHLPHSRNIRSLERIALPYSSSLSIALSRATNLVHINMHGCEKIESFPSTTDLIRLESLNLCKCLNLKTFPEVSTNVRVLDVSYTAIESVPESLGSLRRLETLTVTDCTKLKHLSSSICELESLGMLELSNCSSLQQFPEILKPMYGLCYLFLDGTAIEELPSSIENLESLCWLRLENCKDLTLLPDSLANIFALCGVNFSHCTKLKKMPMSLMFPGSRLQNPDYESYLFTSVSRLSKYMKMNSNATFCYLDGTRLDFAGKLFQAEMDGNKGNPFFLSYFLKLVRFSTLEKERKDLKMLKMSFAMNSFLEPEIIE